jgi:hypothetical protein
MQEVALRAADSAWKSERRRLQPYSLGELQDLPAREYLVKGVLDRGGASVLYAESNTGKSFVSIDIGMHIALGREWCGRRVKNGKVLYIAAEGGLGFHERVRAFQSHHNLTQDIPFYLLPSPVNFCSQAEDAEEVIREAAILGQVDLIVIDTLSRAMSGGNENDSGDMGSFVKYCDLIREKTKAHILIVHHSGKDTTRGARGHSLLRAAVDTEIELTKSEDGIVTVEIKKQRDGRTGDKFNFMLDSVELGTDQDGDPITSCVLAKSDNEPAKRPTVGGRQKRALCILQNLIIDRGEVGIPKNGMAKLTFVLINDFRTALKDGNVVASDSPDSVRRGISTVIEGLNNKGITATWEDKIWIPG